MKNNAVHRMAALGALAVGLVLGNEALAADDEATKALLKKSECTKCHAIDKDKKGPSYRKIAADKRGKADAEASVVKSMTNGQKVKLSDGSEEEHKRLQTQDAAQLKNVAQWILAQ
ncbi:MAG TPA: c-type cytochrome [Albitalea sp.]